MISNHTTPFDLLDPGEKGFPGCLLQRLLSVLKAKKRLRPAIVPELPDFHGFESPFRTVLDEQ